MINQMIEIKHWLEGKKTYICAILCLFTLIARGLNFIDDETTRYLLSIFGLGSVVALKAGQARVKKK